MKEASGLLAPVDSDTVVGVPRHCMCASARAVLTNAFGCSLLPQLGAVLGDLPLFRHATAGTTEVVDHIFADCLSVRVVPAAFRLAEFADCLSNNILCVDTTILKN